MQVGSHGLSHGIGHHRMSDRAQIMHRETALDGPSKGERLVASLDQDSDGALSIAELKDTKLGHRMSIDKFARMDANDDGRLEAGELDASKIRGRKHEHHGLSMMENVIKSQYADYLIAKTDSDDGQTDIAARIIEKLDGDQSGGLNSEEIAGTRLAKLIGGDFYQIDADKNGALNRAELSGFITDHLLGVSSEINPDLVVDGEPGIEIPPSGAGTEATTEAIGSDPQTTTPEAGATATTTNTPSAPQSNSVETAPSSAATRAESITSAFETALEILKNGSGSSNPYDVVQALYGDVQKILESS